MEQQILDNDFQEITDTTNKKWAGFWIRAGASLIDLIIFLPFIGLNMYNLYTLKNLPLQLIVIIILMMYKPFMEFKYGATLGKMAVKIKVVSLDFEKITLSQSFIRNSPYLLSQLISIITSIILFQHPNFQTASSMTEVGSLQNAVISPIISFIPSFFLLICYITVAFTEKKQGIHDLMAKTYCIYK